MQLPDQKLVDASPGKVDQFAAVDQFAGDAAPVECTLGTLYPDRAVIDPDNPDYEEEFHSKAEVTQMFAKAKADNTKAYRGYIAAKKYPDLLLCAFCPCGCGDNPGHLSAVDCFKDFHGFG